MSQDISDILSEWSYDPDDNARIIIGNDGREKIQARLELGLLQMECDGRPDGKKPYGCGSLLDYYIRLLDECVHVNGSDEGFGLNSDVCCELSQEALQYYNRYVIFFQIGDYVRTVRDTERNIKLFDLIKRYAEDEEDRNMLEQYRPYIIRMNCAAKSLFHVSRKEHRQALRHVREGIRTIENLPSMDSSPTFDYEKLRSLKMLRGMEKKILSQTPLSKKEVLARDLKKAIQEERYEDAAKLRDWLKNLTRDAGSHLRQ